MTHTKQVVVESGYEWVLLLKSLILRKDDSELESLYKQSLKRCSEKPNLSEWAADSAKPEPFRSPHMGWVKIAWCLGYYHLKRIVEHQLALDENLYKGVMREVIQVGGDTDTNACIVGGLIGSLLGLRRLPLEYVRKAMTVATETGKGHLKRNSIYNPRHGFELAFRMMRFV